MWFETKVGDLQPTSEKDNLGNETFTTRTVNSESLRFFPIFDLYTLDLQSPKAYRDRVIPAAQAAIQARERPGKNIKLHNSAEISLVGIPLTTKQARSRHLGSCHMGSCRPECRLFLRLREGPD